MGPSLRPALHPWLGQDQVDPDQYKNLEEDKAALELKAQAKDLLVNFKAATSKLINQMAKREAKKANEIRAETFIEELYTLTNTVTMKTMYELKTKEDHMRSIANQAMLAVVNRMLTTMAYDYLGMMTTIMKGLTHQRFDQTSHDFKPTAEENRFIKLVASDIENMIIPVMTILQSQVNNFNHTATLNGMLKAQFASHKNKVVTEATETALEGEDIGDEKTSGQ